MIHLLLDAASVAHSEGVTFHLNPATKHPDNPVLEPGEPHEWDGLQVSWPATVLYSPRDRKFRCWYSGFEVLQSPDRRWKPGYAESDDGVHWTKPPLGQFEFLGRDTNRIDPDWGPEFLSFAFENPLPDAPPAQRFGGYWIETDHQMQGSWGKSLGWSPDGKVWTRANMAYHKVNRMEMQDINQLLYDPEEADPAWRVKGYTQAFIRAPGPPQTSPFLGFADRPYLRHIGLVHGAHHDAVEDADEIVALAPEAGIDEELHFATVMKVDATYVMLFESNRFSRNPIDGDLRIAVSDDGRRFRRVHPHDALVDTGPKGSWEQNLLTTTTTGLQMVGDEVYIFYIGCPSIYNAWPAQYAVSAERRGSQFAPTFMGLATLPRDRFAYAAGAGAVTTHPLTVGSEGLWLNATGDAITVTGLDANGAAIAQGRTGTQISQTVYRRVEWEKAPPAGEVSLRLELGAGARLFSVRY